MSKYINHLTLRVAWHDSCWNGRICQSPSKNPFCVALDRVREERNDEEEDKNAGKGLWELKPENQPPCKAESGFFMSEREWYRLFKHPYQENSKAKETHGHLKPISVKIPPYAAISVPFAGC